MDSSIMSIINILDDVGIIIQIPAKFIIHDIKYNVDYSSKIKINKDGSINDRLYDFYFKVRKAHKNVVGNAIPDMVWGIVVDIFDYEEVKCQSFEILNIEPCPGLKLQDIPRRNRPH